MKQAGALEVFPVCVHGCVVKETYVRAPEPSVSHEQGAGICADCPALEVGTEKTVVEVQSVESSCCLSGAPALQRAAGRYLLNHPGLI